MTTSPVLSTTRDRLAALAELIDHLVAQSGRHYLLGVTDDGTEADLAINAIDSAAPECLLGFVAPAEWSALGVGVTGQEATLGPAPLDPGLDSTHHQGALDDGLGGPAAGQRSVRVAFLLDRTGVSHGRIRVDGGTARDLVDEDPSGALVDVCHRALGLPTSSPEQSPTLLWASIWLEQIIDQLEGSPAPISWERVTELHPGVEIIGRADSRAAAAALADLGATGRALGRALDWEELRHRRAAGQGPLPEPTPADATWMDEGIFSRWSLAAFPPLADLTDAATSLVPGPVAARVREVLGEWGLAQHP